MSLSKNALLNRFRDNNTGGIDAADMRILINTLYEEMVLLEDILDRADIYDSEKAASINQVSIIKDELTRFIISHKSDYYEKEDTYSKSEVHALLDADYYKKSEVYSKIEIDRLFNNLR